MEAGKGNSLSPVIWYRKEVDAYIQHVWTACIAHIVAYEVLSYSDMKYAVALYYFEDGGCWVEDRLWSEYVEITGE